MKKVRSIQDGTLKRLPKYLNMLKAFQIRQREFITNEHLASFVGFKPITILEDLEQVDSWTSNSNIHNIDYLIEKIESFLGFQNQEETFIVGGNPQNISFILEKAKELNLQTIAIFTEDGEMKEKELCGIKIFSLSKIQELSKRMHIMSAIIFPEKGQAQDLTDKLSDYGFNQLYNCSESIIITPDTMELIDCF